MDDISENPGARACATGVNHDSRMMLSKSEYTPPAAPAQQTANLPDLELSAEWTITHDANQWILCRSRMRRAETYLHPVAYVGTRKSIPWTHGPIPFGNGSANE